MLRALLVLLGLLAAGCGSVESTLPDGPLRIERLRLLATHIVPSGTAVLGTPVGGLSGLDRVPDGTWYLLSDDPSQQAPARFYTATLEVVRDTLAVVLHGAVALRAEGGDPLPTFAADPEALRYDPSTGTLLWTSEGDVERGISPTIWESTPEGAFVRALPLPDVYAISATRGPRPNGVFEGLALDSGGLWVITELPLRQDGPVPDATRGGLVRMSRLDRVTGAVTRQVVYPTDPLAAPPDPPAAFAVNGVVELLDLDTDRLLVLERSFSIGAGYSVHLYEADLKGATDVQAVDVLEGANFTPVAKRLVADFSDFLPYVDNVEGMAWGPETDTGRRTLVFVSDDNFNAFQQTQVLVFEVIPAP